jgi:abequosyltransferase
MSSTLQLSIFVPTYDRNVALSILINRLLNYEFDAQVNICVIDNMSPLPVEDSLRAEGIDISRLTVLRNSANVGANANILRCFELAKTEWVWVLGDSDLPEPDALQKLTAVLAEHPDALMVRFTDSADARVSTGIDAFVQDITSFGSTLFISSAVFNVKALRNGLKFGHQFAYSMAPHLVLLLHQLNDNGKVVSLPGRIVIPAKVNKEDSWPTMPSYLGFPTIVELPSIKRRSTIRLLGRKIATTNHQVIKAYYHTVKHRDDGDSFEKDIYYFEEVGLRTAHASGSIRQFLLFIVLRMTIRLPYLSDLIVRAIESRLGRQPVVGKNFSRL